MLGRTIFIAFVAIASFFLGTGAFAAGDLISKFTNQGSVVNTRHNLRQKDGPPGPTGAIMTPYRNDYGEVCVYCHTPHGANSTAGAPLWNKALPVETSFQTYNSGTLTQAVTAPGVNSLMCLSCHDGQTAIDSIYNMPGSGRYSATPDVAFLSTWTASGNNGDPNGYTTSVHLALSVGNTGCLACHSPAAGLVGSGAADFTAAVIGQNLRDDHPIGVRFPGGTPATTGFNSGTLSAGNITYFDRDSNARLSKGDPRFYDTGNGPEVECASCHDPHGVPSAAAGSTFNPTFLRVANTGSGLCLVCHAK